MRFFCPYGASNNFVEVYVNPVTKADYALVESWLIFDRENCPGSILPSERTNYLPWDITIKNIGLFNGDIIKVTSNRT